MSSSQQKREKKGKLIKLLYERLSKYKQIIVVNLMNVGANQVQQVRQQMFKKNSHLMIGKNTVLRKAIKLRMSPLDEKMEDYEFYKRFGEPMPQLEKLNELCKNKVGLLFTDEPPFELKPIIEGNKVQTQARVGVISPCDYFVPEGPTGLDPSQISFFHALNISTKIQKGQIEIVKQYQVCAKGREVGNSEAILLQKLSLKPFLYGMEILKVYDDGSILTPDVVSLTPDDILKKFCEGVANISGLSLELGIPTECSVPHLIANAFKNLAAISLETPYKLAALENLQQQAKAPSSPVKTAAKKEEPKKEEPKKEEEPEADMDMGDLFGF